MRKRILLLITLSGILTAAIVILLVKDYPPTYSERFEQRGDALVIEGSERNIRNSIRQIAIAPDNSVWAATSQGVAHFERGLWRFLKSSDGLIDNDTTSVEVANDGAVWIGTVSGVSHFDSGTWHNYTQTHGLLDNKVTAIKVGPDQKVWISTCANSKISYPYKGECPGAFSWFDGHAWDVVNVSPTVPGDKVFPPRYLDFVDPQGRPWLNTGLYGLAYLDNNAWIRVQPSVYAAAYAPDNSRWGILIGTRFYAGRREWESVFYTSVAVCRWRTNDESHCYAIAPLFDRSYSLRGKVQEMVSVGEVNLASTPSALAGRRLFSLAIAPDGAVWVATDQNVVCFDGQDWYSYDATQGKHVSEIEIALDGSIWAITSQTEAGQEDPDPSARMMRISVERLRPSIFDKTCRWIGP